MNRMKNLFTLLTLLLWTLVACSNDSAADEKPGSGGTDIPAGNLPMQNVARAIELIDNAVECYFTGTGMAMSRYYNPYTGNRSSELGQRIRDGLNAGLPVPVAGGDAGQAVEPQMFGRKRLFMILTLTVTRNS